MTDHSQPTAGESPGDRADPASRWAEQDWISVLLTRLIRTAGLLQPDQPLAGQPVSLSEAFALAELAGAAPLTQRDLAERLNLEKSTVSRLVAGLERRGLVSRRRNPDNRRAYQLTLTEQGRSVTRRLVASMHTHHTRLLAVMTQAERDALATGVAALLRAMGHTPPLGAQSPPTATSIATGTGHASHPHLDTTPTR